jgi:tRNA (guanine-N7-)-methyltransferase
VSSDRSRHDPPQPPAAPDDGPGDDAGGSGERRLYGRRRGRRLRPGQQALFETVLPRIRLDPPPGGARLDPAALFPRPTAALWLEVGFGAGEHLAWQAAHHRDIGMIGCEPFVNGIAGLLRAVADQDLDNVRVHPGDGRDVLDALPDGAIGRCFVLFPDPWPKRRHHGRRFVQPETLDALARTMAPGAELRLASDNPGMIDWMLWHVRAHPAFAWAARRAADWRTRPTDWPPTRYERKALHGRPVFLRMVRLGP